MRFNFGKNWLSYLNNLTEEKIELAKGHLSLLLGVDDLHGKSFIDIGSGSGIMSLAALRLGADVMSFDYDENSVKATQSLKDKFGNDSRGSWKVEQGSILDAGYVSRLGKFDVIYSWGVLHHTGAMWQAIDATTTLAAKDSLLYIAIYNDQGSISRFWHGVKYLYNLNAITRFLMYLVFVPYFYGISALSSLLRLKNPIRTIKEYDKDALRGMSFYHDVIDWIGGYPFEYCGAGEIFTRLKEKGFSLVSMKTTSAMGCNEFVFRKN